MPFGQVVIGPPGSGKTTYCAGLQQFYGAIKRECAVVNLDPANDTLPYDCAVNIADLVSLPAVMATHGLGPNGGLMFCMETLEANLDWLQQRLPADPRYVIFDCPGQVELFTHHTSLARVLAQLEAWGYRIAVVNLVDAQHCTDPATFVSALIVSLSAMLHLHMPHINILSKIDLLRSYGKLAFNLDFYTDVLDLGYLVDHLRAEGGSNARFHALTQRLCEVVEDYNLVAFFPLNVEDKDTMLAVTRAVDKANGYIYGGLTPGNTSIFEVAHSELHVQDIVDTVQDKYMDSSAFIQHADESEWDLA